MTQVLRRFYKQVAVTPAAESGFNVTLDGKVLKTPEHRPLWLGTRGLADAVAAEWAAQEKEIRPSTMPMMQLACTASDRVPVQREKIIAELLKYAETDLLCYRAEHPEDLVARQTALWQPLLDWLSVRFGVTLPVTAGLIPQDPDPQAQASLRQLLESYDTITMTALQSAVYALGSLVLGLALIEGRLSPAEAFAAAVLDETYQIELWGEDPEATSRRAALADDIAATQRFLLLCRDETAPLLPQ